MTRYGLEILYHCEKRVKTKSQKVLGANSNNCRDHSGKNGGGWLFACPILNMVKIVSKIKVSVLKI